MKKQLLLTIFTFFFYSITVTSQSTSCSETPTNVFVNGITSSSATISWLASGTSTTWEVIVLPCGTIPTSTSVGIITTSNPIVLNDLTSEYCYAVCVRAVCSATETSNWSTPLTFTTTIAPPVCGGLFVDNGGEPGNYANNSNVTYTI